MTKHSPIHLATHVRAAIAMLDNRRLYRGPSAPEREKLIEVADFLESQPVEPKAATQSVCHRIPPAFADGCGCKGHPFNCYYHPHNCGCNAVKSEVSVISGSPTG